MKAFTFSLEKMYNYKEQILNVEKNTLAQLRARRDEISDEITYLEKSRLQKKIEMDEKALNGMSVFDLQSYNFMIENMQKQIKVLKEELKKQEILVEKQVEVVKLANMDMASLEKLESKQKESYKKEVLKQNSEEILEIVTNALHQN